MKYECVRDHVCVAPGPSVMSVGEVYDVEKDHPSVKAGYLVPIKAEKNPKLTKKRGKAD